MKNNPIPGIAILTILLACGLAPAAEQTYESELRHAQNQKSQRQFRKAIEACDQALTRYKDPLQAKELRLIKAECLTSDGQHEKALTELAGLAKDFADDGNLQAAVLLIRGNALRATKKFDDAIAAYRKVVDGYGKQAELATEALLRTGELLSTDMKDPAKGIAAYRELETKFAADHPKNAAEAARRVALILETQTGDMVQAAEAYQSLTTKHAAMFDERTVAGFFGKSVECLRRAGKTQDAVTEAKRAEDGLRTGSLKADFILQQGDALAEMKKFPEARAEYERAIYTYPLEQNVCQSAQAKIVETYRSESKWQEALGAARVMYDAAANDQQIQNAAQVVARAFLAVDGNLGRANAFLVYQRHGAKGPDGKEATEDDVPANHLADVKYPPTAADADKGFKNAIAACPATSGGYRTRAFLYVYWGKPKEAAASFLQAFKAAALNEVAASAQELVMVGMKAQTASFNGLDRIFEYVSYGPKGKSGKENLPDPFAGLQ